MLTDWLAILSALFAAVGLVFAGYQARRLHRDGVREHKLERDGVVVSWTPLTAPNHAEPDGRAIWVYEFEAHNPGRFTVDDIVITVQSPRAFSALAMTAACEPRTRVMTLRTPVLRGGSSRKWTRYINMEYAGPNLGETFADISLFDADQSSARTAGLGLRATERPRARPQADAADAAWTTSGGIGRRICQVIAIGRSPRCST